MATDVTQNGRPMTAAFGLIDTTSGNMVGGFASEREALLAVAATAREHGAESDAVLSLSLFRWDVPPEQGHIADGEELVRRALDAATPADQRAAVSPPA
jgi:hypothetical protein